MNVNKSDDDAMTLVQKFNNNTLYSIEKTKKYDKLLLKKLCGRE